MRTSELARRAGVSPDTVRFYERRGVLARARRTSNGYRQYPRESVERVRLVRRALALGFTLDELRLILITRDTGGTPCRAVRALAAEKLEALETRLEELERLRDRIRAVLRDWDARLSRTPRGERAGLLQALVDLVPEGMPSPLVPGRWLASTRSGPSSRR
jgi:DNA-binding transcriptional MerR regulator